MAGLFYVGLDPGLDRDVENRIDAEASLNVGVSRLYVQGRVSELSASKATKAYVDTQDGLYASASYVAAQDALNVPVGAKGIPNGVASLGVDGTIPPEQVPNLGTGILRGPYPTTHTFNGNAFDVPLKIADWELGVIGLTCQPWVFMAVGARSVGGRPVVEVRAGTPAQTTYASQTLVAHGYGRNYYYDYQVIEVFPQDPDLNEGQDGVQDSFAPTMNMVLTAWVYDDAGGQTFVDAGFVITASAFLARLTL